MGISCGKTWEKAFMRGASKGWEESLTSAGSWPKRIHSLKASNSWSCEWSKVVRKTSNLGLSWGFFCELGLRGCQGDFLVVFG